MAEQEIHHKATEPTVKRSLTGSVAGDLLMMAGNGAAFTAGKIATEQIAQHITNRPKAEKTELILPSSHEEK